MMRVLGVAAMSLLLLAASCDVRAQAGKFQGMIWPTTPTGSRNV